ncbi:MAG: hypothetical protein MAG795_00670 [Candidatus Woesearchaeota archaeon]|nr:hypothetical protein [Candidatus Woesearchaeota archaeon]
MSNTAELMENYRGYKYTKENNIWKVFIGDTFFIVGLDDSKTKSCSRFIEEDRNNEETCKRYIDWLLED